MCNRSSIQTMLTEVISDIWSLLAPSHNCIINLELCCSLLRTIVNVLPIHIDKIITVLDRSNVCIICFRLAFQFVWSYYIPKIYCLSFHYRFHHIPLALVTLTVSFRLSNFVCCCMYLVPLCKRRKIHPSRRACFYVIFIKASFNRCFFFNRLFYIQFFLVSVVCEGGMCFVLTFITRVGPM